MIAPPAFKFMPVFSPGAWFSCVVFEKNRIFSFRAWLQKYIKISRHFHTVSSIFLFNRINRAKAQQALQPIKNMLLQCLQSNNIARFLLIDIWLCGWSCVSINKNEHPTVGRKVRELVRFSFFPVDCVSAVKQP
jgi:hypothetical protein